MSSNDPSSICDACSAEIELDETETCKECRAGCCSDCIGDHGCVFASDEADDA